MIRCYAILLLLIFVPAAPAQFRAKWVDFPAEVYCLAFSPDGKFLATGTGTRGSGEASLVLWEVATGKRWRELPGHDSCSSLAFSPDGKTLVANGAKGPTTHIWDIPSLRIRKSIKVRPGQARCLAISPDGKILAAGGVNPVATLWSLETGEKLRVFDGLGKVGFLTFSPDGKSLATCAGRDPPVVWDVASGKKRFVLPRPFWRVFRVAFAPDGKTLYCLDEQGHLVYWDTATWKERRVVNLLKQRQQSTDLMTLSPGGKTMAIWGNGGLHLLDVDTATYYKGDRWEYQWGFPWCIAFSPDGKLLATGSGGSKTTNAVYLWNVPDPKKKQQ